MIQENTKSAVITMKFALKHHLKLVAKRITGKKWRHHNIAIQQHSILRTTMSKNYLDAPKHCIITPFQIIFQKTKTFTKEI